MLAGCEVSWRLNVRQAVSSSKDGCNGDAAPGGPPLPTSRLLGLGAGGAEAPGGARVSTGAGSGGGFDRGAANTGALLGASSNVGGVNADRPGPSGPVSERRVARSSTRRSDCAGPRTAPRFAIGAVDIASDVAGSVVGAVWRGSAGLLAMVVLGSCVSNGTLWAIGALGARCAIDAPRPRAGLLGSCTAIGSLACFSACGSVSSALCAVV